MGEVVWLNPLEAEQLSLHKHQPKTMHQLLRLKSKFPNHFAFTLGRYLFLLLWVQFI
jgi:hypothetical protein